MSTAKLYEKNTAMNINHIEKGFSNTCRIYLNGLDGPFEVSQRYTPLFKKKYQP